MRLTAASSNVLTGVQKSPCFVLTFVTFMAIDKSFNSEISFIMMAKIRKIIEKSKAFHRKDISFYSIMLIPWRKAAFFLVESGVLPW